MNVLESCKLEMPPADIEVLRNVGDVRDVNVTRGLKNTEANHCVDHCGFVAVAPLTGA